MRPALGPDKDFETVRLMRDVFEPGIGLMIDAHTWWRMGDHNYSPDTVNELARAMFSFHPTWLEEPLPPEDHAAYRKLCAAGTLPIATGEHEPDEAGFVDLIETGAADYIQMDVCCQGGFAMGQRIFDAVAHEGLRFAFHSWGTTLEILAAAHLGICWPADVVEWLEYPCYSNAGRPGMYPFRSLMKFCESHCASNAATCLSQAHQAWAWKLTNGSSKSIRSFLARGHSSRLTRRPKPSPSRATTA